MKLRELSGNPQNPRVIDADQKARLKKSLDTFGDLSGVVFNEVTRHLVGGHMRKGELPADSEIFIEEKFAIPTRTGTTALGYIVVDGEKFSFRQVRWDETMEKAAAIAANHHGGEDEPKQLAQWLLDLDTANIDLDLTGMSTQEIEDICAPFRTMPDEGEDEVGDPPKVAASKRGELYLLGEHRVLCGDSTSKEDVERLMAGEKADMVYTDPPYGINLETDYVKRYGNEKSSRESAVYGDDSGIDLKKILEFSKVAKEVFVWGADNYPDCLPRGGSWVVWDKSVPAVDGIASDFELCWSRERHHYSMIRKLWKGAKAREETGQEGAHRTRWGHPTQKPIELATYFFNHWGKKTKSVLDFFLGSGTCLIACEKTNRRCFGMEIAPEYIDVILDRFIKFTGKKVYRLNSDGSQTDWADIKTERGKT